MTSRYNSLSRDAHKTHLDLKRAVNENEALSAALQASKNETVNLRDQRDALQKELANKPKKSFWKRVFQKKD